MADNKESGKKPNIPLKPGKKGKFNFYWIYAIMFLLIFVFYITNTGDSATKTDWPQLIEMLQNEDVEKRTL